MEFVYYRDRKHMEEVITKMEKDEDMGRLYKQSLDLITPGTSFILGEFNRLNEPDVPSSTATYFFREALRRIWTSKRSSFVAISMIADLFNKKFESPEAFVAAFKQRTIDTLAAQG